MRPPIPEDSRLRAAADYLMTQDLHGQVRPYELDETGVAQFELLRRLAALAPFWHEPYAAPFVPIIEAGVRLAASIHTYDEET